MRLQGVRTARAIAWQRRLRRLRRRTVVVRARRWGTTVTDRARTAVARGRLTADSADADRVADMVFDAVDLGHTVRDGELHVSYPLRGADGGTAYGRGFPVGPVPPTYWTDPPNVITAERVALWAALLGGRWSTTTDGDTNEAAAGSENAGEDAIDAAVDMTFPASDPPAWMGSVLPTAPATRSRRTP